MLKGVLLPERVLLREPRELLTWTTVCRMGWEEFLRRRHNGLTQQMRLQLLEEFSAMKKVMLRLFPEEPVRVEDRAIVYDPSKMEINKIYPVEVQGRLHLVRKTEANVVETYELEPNE